MELTKEQREYAEKLEQFLQYYKAVPGRDWKREAMVNTLVVSECPTWDEFVATTGVNSAEHFATFMMGIECGATIGYLHKKVQ